MSAKGNDLAGGPSGLPRHIAVIMDGNGRWAKRQGLPRTAGHSAGAENWKRPKDEVDGIMALLERYLRQALRDMDKEKVRIRIFGDLAPFSPELRRMCEQCMERSAAYTGGQVNICLNYGGRDEIVRAAKKWAAEGCPELDEDRFGSYMWGGSIPDPDLLIRPGGEKRISNFLLWELAYAELYFSDVLWPDFDEAELDKAIAAYCGRERRFGAVGESQ